MRTQAIVSNRTLMVSAWMFSLILHALLLYLLFQHPPLIRVNVTKLFPQSQIHPTVNASKEKKIPTSDQKSKLLEEALDEMVVLVNPEPTSPLVEEALTASLQSLPQEVEEKSFFPNLEDDEIGSLPIAALVPKEEWEEESIDKEENLEMFEQQGISRLVSLLTKESFESHDISFSQEEIVPGPEELAAQILNKDFFVDESFTQTIAPVADELGLGGELALSTKQLFQKASQDKRLKEEISPLIDPNSKLSEEELLSRYPIDKSLDNYHLPAVAMQPWNTQFDTQLITYQNPEDEALYFSIELKNKNTLAASNLQTSYLFVIDATSFQITKDFSFHIQALLKSLKYLSKGDNFNIAICGKRVVLLSSSFLNYNMQNYLAAEAFLNKHKVEQAYDSYLFLENIHALVQDTLSSKNLCHVFLIGSTSSKAKKLDEGEELILRRVIKSSQGKASFFGVQLCKEPKSTPSPIFEALSSTTGGKILLPPTQAAYPRKFAALVLDAKTVLLKNLLIDTSCEDAEASLILHPSSSTWSHFYERKPLKIYGRISKATPFTLRIKGMNDQELVLIEKKIDLSYARKGTKYLVHAFENAKRSDAFQAFVLGYGKIPDTLPKVRNSKSTRKTRELYYPGR